VQSFARVQCKNGAFLRRTARPQVEASVKRRTLRFGAGFRVAFANRRAQAAEMTISPGNGEGGPDNRHRGADQWLFVVAGRGVATVGRRRIPLAPGTLLLVEQRERHEIRNTGRTALRTLNFYVPPAYTRSGDPRPRGRK
jgi:mannose-6-phosphate isomerase-like protein (cupin superfamily)